ncbi:MAG: 30S ribosomal protein S9 [Spirochaetales bacterium]|nr:MAG: 30S ribosomal protein S9 [Spirochaetales bacterium]
MVKNLAISIGRRRTAIARVFLRDGSGQITVNDKPVQEYFVDPECLYIVKQPLMVLDAEGKFDILINVNGGGIHGQAGACRHGLARALQVYDASNTAPLRASGFLTRDPRMVERKKYGQRKARRKFQFSKR